jgi:hypothetical protein
VIALCRSRTSASSSETHYTKLDIPPMLSQASTSAVESRETLDRKYDGSWSEAMEMP